MSGMSRIVDEVHAIWSKAEAAGDTVAADVKALFHRLTGDAPAVEAEVKADADELVRVGGDTVGAVAHEAETAAAPVVTEAENDAEILATEVKTDVQAAVGETPASHA